MEKTDEQKAAEAAAVEEKRVADEAARAAREQEAQDKLRAEQDARIRAEAERDALKLAVTAAPKHEQSEWSDTQWKDFEEQTGVSKRQFLAQAQVAKQLVDAQKAEFEKQLAELRKRTDEAEAKAARVDGYRSEEATKREYYATRPALARHDKDVMEFVNQFPATERSDPKRYQLLLGMAETYVRGKVGAAMRANPGSSQRLERDDVEPVNNDSVEVDYSGLDKGQSDMLRSIVPTAEKEKELSQYAKTDKSGVEFRGESEWDMARVGIRKQFGKF